MENSLKINQRVLLNGIVKALDCSGGYWRYGIEVEYSDDVRREYGDKLFWVTNVEEHGMRPVKKGNDK